MTVTEKEMPVAQDVFSACGPLVEVDQLVAYTCQQFSGDAHLPFVLVRAADRGNLSMAYDIQHWMYELRPQVFLLVGTAGGIWRPVDASRDSWRGLRRGDVAVSEYIHFGDYRKVTQTGDRLRYHRLEQPADYLLTQARSLINDPQSWHRWLGNRWSDASGKPVATEVEMVVGEQIQDNPMHATQQFLMQTFDRAGAAEMEAAGIAQALHSMRRTATYAPMYLSLRGVSDLIWACGPDGPLTEADLERAKQFDTGETGTATQDKTTERDGWSPRAAAAASAFALGLVERLVRRQVNKMPGHPVIPSMVLETVGACG